MRRSHLSIAVFGLALVLSSGCTAIGIGWKQERESLRDWSMAPGKGHDNELKWPPDLCGHWRNESPYWQFCASVARGIAADTHAFHVGPE
ncbi:MAG: hypothetical protein ACKVX7_03625 [Planctomycetota bacterium]